MAHIKSGTVGTGSPLLAYELYADTVGGSGNQRTIKVTVNFKVNGGSSSYFGYPCNWRAMVHTSWGGWAAIKGSETWRGDHGWRGFSQTLTIDVGTTSSVNIGVGFQTDSFSGSNSWDGSASGNFATGSTNTAPWMSGGVTVRNNNSGGEVLNGYIPENVSQLYLSWNQGGDNEQGASGLKYGVNQIVNGGGASTILYPTYDTACHVGIGSGNEGQTLQYYVDCRDNSDALSTNRADSPVLTKNTLNNAGFTGHSNNIVYDTTGFDLYVSRPSNNNGAPAYCSIYSDRVTIHNRRAFSGTTETIKIVKDGEAIPSTPFIYFNDLKNAFAGSSYNGTLHVGIESWNDYGTYKYTGGAVSVDLRTNPNPAYGQEISTDPTLSTMYKKNEGTGNYYFIPDGSLVARVHWNGGSGKLGESVSSELFVAYGGGGWSKLADLPVHGGYNYYNHVISRQNAMQQFKYLIRTTNSYGYYSDAVTYAENLHYYNNPSISTGLITRGATTAEVKLTVKTNSSIPNIETVGTWSMSVTGETGNLSQTQNEQVVTVSNLTDDGTYTLTVSYNDNTGLGVAQTGNISIGANQPLLFVNKYGVGVNGAKADSDNALRIRGAARNQYGPLLAPTHSSISPDDGTSLDSVGNSYGFNYGTSSGVHGPYISFGSLWGKDSYFLQLTGTYHGDNVFKVRTHNGDRDAWNPWMTLWHSGNFDITNPTVSTINTTSNGQGNNVRLGDDCTIGDVNRADTFGIKGLQDSRSGWIRFGDGGLIGYYGHDPERHVRIEGRTLAWQEFSSDHHSNAQFEVRSNERGIPRILLHSPVRCYGSIAMDEGDIMSTHLERAGQLRIRNDNGEIKIGPVNSGWCHFNTSMPQIFMDKTLAVMGDIYGGPDYNQIHIKSDTNTIFAMKYADNTYMHVACHDGARGINWWSSDMKLKTHITPLDGRNNIDIPIDKLETFKMLSETKALDKILAIAHYGYDIQIGDSEEHCDCGYIAQQLETVDGDFVFSVEQPETVKHEILDDEGETYMIDVPNPSYFKEDPVIRNPKPSAIIPYITKAIQEQQEIIEQLMKRIEELEAK